MIKEVRKIYSRLIAGIMLFTAETLLAIILFCSAFLIFLGIAKYVFLEKKTEFDQAAFAFLNSFISDDLTHFMLFFTYLGNFGSLLTANILLTSYFLFIRKHRWYSIKIPAVALGSVIIMSLLKIWFNRSRPLIPLLEPARGLSFPSGHAMSSVTFFGLIIYFIARRPWSLLLRTVLIGLLVCLIILIGLSRVYLRVHYASDVLAGFCAGIIWLIISLWLLRRIELYTSRELNPVVKQH